MRLKALFFIALCTGVSAVALAQERVPEYPYRSAENPYYWKNKPPYTGYWQQDVHYRINAHISESDNIVNGHENLTYYNNSPDTLTYVYFHLYQQAFTKGSHLNELFHANKIKTKFGKYQREGLGTTLNNVKVDGKGVLVEEDNTVIKVYLPKPMLPGDSAQISMDFRTYFDQGTIRRRMQLANSFGSRHYNGVHWYPRIAVYDRKFGWETDQHLNKELYGDYGTYDVELNFASSFVVEATGTLTNRDEVLPKELREKLDIKNFANKPWNEAPSVITPYIKNERKVWKYHAVNVHDFAFTADPNYRIGEAFWNGVRCVAVVQEPHASKWQNAADYVAEIIKTYSEGFGMYAYPKMVAADANDGMEYPMITLDGGGDPGYRSLLAHEIGHNWFYGMLGNNETYRGFMDEGFTQFLTSYGLEKIEGKYMPEDKPAGWYKKRFYQPSLVRERSVYYGYMRDAVKEADPRLNKHSNDFNSAIHHENGYGHVYYKTATMLYNLQYVLGDSLFSEAMKNYVREWSICHPYPEDFRNSFVHFTKSDLNWFFDQWLETNKNINYSVRSIKKVAKDSFAIKFVRKGQMQMPIDFTVTGKDGAQHDFYIPNTWFSKSTGATVLPKWYGWDKMYKKHTAIVNIPGGIKRVQIDTSYRLADVNPMNNVKGRFLPSAPQAVNMQLDKGVRTALDTRHYQLKFRPDVWYNSVDGIKAGVHFDGNYMNYLHQFSANVWWNTHVGQPYEYLSRESEGWYDRYSPINFSLNYKTPLKFIDPRLFIRFEASWLDGLLEINKALDWQATDNDLLSMTFGSMRRLGDYQTDYLINPKEWNPYKNARNNYLQFLWQHNYKYMSGNGRFNITGRAPFTNSSDYSFDYSYLQGELVNYHQLGKFELNTRFFARWGFGEFLPTESALYLSGASPEEMMDNKYTRSEGIFPKEWGSYTPNGFNHFHYGGGLNLRGFAGYATTEEHNGQLYTAYKGRSGAAINVELEFDKFFRWKPRFTRSWLKVDAYAFADAASIELNRYTAPDYTALAPSGIWSDLRADAGLGAAFTIKRFPFVETASPLTIRFDMPFFVNRIPDAQTNYVDFRWVIGVRRAF